ncbi:phosphate acyltransferase [Marinilactibacillus psychrotolerans]|uniref:Phosphate acyltransferase n=2 Tax=Marinilactibacillus psychrotolerans TaxID=191770 RepID=A0AAV3WAI2_9LACT|nr:phosphate acyltransferase PlsX [Marinilactibacillus psychrotolerans]SDD35423.1 phosphate:acyl-[acyl carrier protein] acyltransferase [Marinilactibacillus psychrotolerans]SJN34852.1 Phosphate:acyl-ACP acyltransferase PlsX [Marinilactibacillus psychrotolerans 42ea]GEL68081.1 phosphate acyltransferase [Marinilactibacillus psychrotolerans]GEQ32924.1 phosphate acyltransferase [Marinilactibacillus psychrotolerans]GEQ36821.1 phosphate acyltransferase [Marinilactibacillus psychrotolerans]
MRIAVDAMGGDNAPQAIVEGSIKAAKEFKDITIVLYGKQHMIKKYINEELENIEIVHTDEKIESEDDPVRSIRRKKDASMVMAAKSVKDQENDALFSAGNTGALLASGTLIIGRVKGIDRPGLLATMPVMADKQDAFNLLDVGANADSKPSNINQYATLGTYYAKFVRGIDNPRVGLLNNGTEENKGNEVTKEAYKLLKQNEAINFIGNVESRELLNGIADVVVADGFTGNAVLKTIEGTALSMVKLIKDSILNNGLKAKMGGLLLKDSLSNLKDVLDYSKHGGAVLLGLKAPVVKTHGSATSEPVYQTLKQIREMLSSHVVEDLVKYYDKEK